MQFFTHSLFNTISVTGFDSLTLQLSIKYYLIECHSLLNTFVFNLGHLYGVKELTHNSHLLLHLKEVIEEVGSLTEVNAYVFEHANGLLRNLISGNNNVGKQIARKDNLLFETKLKLLDSEKTSSLPILRVKSKLETRFRPLVDDSFVNLQFATLSYNDHFYTSQTYGREKKTRNSVVMLGPHSFLFIECYVQNTDDSVFAIGRRGISLGNFSHTVHKSDGNASTLRVPYIHKVEFSDKFELVDIADIFQKCLLIEEDSVSYCILVHNSYAF